MIEQTTSPTVDSAEPAGELPFDEPRPLPYSAYPRARDAARHGLQPLPESLPTSFRQQPSRIPKPTRCTAVRSVR